MAKQKVSREVLMAYKELMLMLPRRLTIDEIGKVHIAYVLARNEMRMTETARELDIDRKTLYRKVLEIKAQVEA